MHIGHMTIRTIFFVLVLSKQHKRIILDSFNKQEKETCAVYHNSRQLAIVPMYEL